VNTVQGFSVVILGVAFYSYSERLYAKFRYAECRGVLRRQYQNAQLPTLKSSSLFREQKRSIDSNIAVSPYHLGIQLQDMQHSKALSEALFALDTTRS
jgi:hypothetical protein